MDCLQTWVNLNINVQNLHCKIIPGEVQFTSTGHFAVSPSAFDSVERHGPRSSQGWMGVFLHWEKQCEPTRCRLPTSLSTQPHLSSPEITYAFEAQQNAFPFPNLARRQSFASIVTAASVRCSALTLLSPLSLPLLYDARFGSNGEHVASIWLHSLFYQTELPRLNLIRVNHQSCEWTESGAEVARLFCNQQGWVPLPSIVAISFFIVKKWIEINNNISVIINFAFTYAADHWQLGFQGPTTRTIEDMIRLHREIFALHGF